MSETYFEKRKCENCGKENTLNIPKGTTIKDFLKNVKCFNCGCELKNDK